MNAWAHILRQRKYTIELAESCTLMAPPTLFFFRALAAAVGSEWGRRRTASWAGLKLGTGGGREWGQLKPVPLLPHQGSC